MNKREVGALYEQKAAEYLLHNGYELLEKNYRCRIGEIDIIAKSENYLVFVEVKYRSSNHVGYPGEAITKQKIRKLTQTAEYYILQHKLPQSTPCRFDVVVILDHEITLIKNAFGGI